MNTEELFQDLYEWEDIETGLQLSLEENNDNKTYGYFRHGENTVALVYLDYYDELDTLDIAEVNMAGYSDKGVMSKYVVHIGQVCKEHEVKYISVTPFSGAVSIAEENGMQENTIHEVGSMILSVEDWDR